jgi:hypothetical protein
MHGVSDLLWNGPVRFYCREHAADEQFRYRMLRMHRDNVEVFAATSPLPFLPVVREVSDDQGVENLGWAWGTIAWMPRGLETIDDQAWRRRDLCGEYSGLQKS